MSKQKTKKQPEKKGEILNLTNGMIDGFVSNPSITKLRQLPGLRAGDRFQIFRLWETVTNSPEFKALVEAKNLMVEEHNKKQDKLPKDKRTTLTLDDPKVKELFEMESGLKVERLVISNSHLNEQFTSFDMTATKWIIKFEE